MGSIRNQVLGLVIGLVIATSITILTLFWLNTSEFTRTSVAAEIESATDTFEQLYRSRETRLVTSAALLTSDFGFKQAVATRDAPTIESVLLNHAQRVGADLMFVTDLGGEVIAVTRPAVSAGSLIPFPTLLSDAAVEGASLSLVEFDGVLYQLVTVPVRAPRPIAFTAVGFEFESKVAEELKTLTDLDVTLLIYRDKAAPRIVSTLAPDEVSAGIDAPASVDPRFGLPFFNANPLVSRHQTLSGSDGDVGELILTAKLDQEFQALARLRDEILIAFIVVLLIAAVGALIFANNITSPLNRLVGTAMQMASGRYDAELKTRYQSLEVKTLFEAFSEMGHDIKEREALIRWQAEHDELTGLLTGQAALTFMNDQLADPSRSVIVMSYVLEAVRDISDALGPAVADDYLHVIAGRLKNHPETLVAARIGTNEFIQVIELPDNEDTEAACRSCLYLLQEPIQIREMLLRRTMRAGYAVFPEDGTSAERLFRRASIAMQRASHEQLLLRRYIDGEEEDHVRRLRIINDLKSALTADDGQLFMVYQPKLNLTAGRIDKLEALIRWVHPELDFISPELFISLAEQSSLIIELTDWVVKTVIRQRGEWEAKFPDLQIAINVSAQDLERETLLPNVLEQLESHALMPSALCFEMTERDVMNDADKAVKLMSKFRDQGFDLSVDDYGIGQSSLSKLKQMPVDEIKIDKAFIVNLESSTSDQIITQSTIDLGHRFGLKVIAEGVETAGAQTLLMEYGCDYIQGYFLCRPLPPTDLERWLGDFNDAARTATKT